MKREEQMNGKEQMERDGQNNREKQMKREEQMNGTEQMEHDGQNNREKQMKREKQMNGKKQMDGTEQMERDGQNNREKQMECNGRMDRGRGMRKEDRMKRGGNVLVVSSVLAVALVAAMALCSGVGVVRFDWRSLTQSPIFWNLRLPRVVLSVVVGAALSVSGAVYQSVFRNPLTDPYVLGISSGASLGAAIAILLGWEAHLWGVGGLALATALLTILVIFKMASMGNRMHTTTLLLTGVCLTFLITAVISLLMALRQDKMESIIFWTMGSFASASWVDVWITLPVVALGILVALYYCRDLNLLLGGSEMAQSLGVEVEKVRRRLLLATTLMVAFSVSACGVIGFVGLVVPHCVRLVCGADNRRVVPYSVFVGGLFLLLCDTAARTLIPPNELPVGSITSLVGAPMFIYLLYKSKRRI